jgi:hypothetical protein
MDDKQSEMSKGFAMSSASVDGVSTQTESANKNPEHNKSPNSPHDDWELFRKFASFKPDEHKGRMIRIALLTLVVIALALAIILLRNEYWRAAGLRPAPRAITSLNIGQSGAAIQNKISELI